MIRKSMFALTAALGMTLLAPAAEAGDRWGFQFGFDSRGGHVRVGYAHGHRGGDRGYRRWHHRPHHAHVRVPAYSRVWVEPVFQTVVAGYDHCGNPLFRRVLVRSGYWHNQVTGYHCGTCSAVLH